MTNAEKDLVIASYELEEASKKAIEAFNTLEEEIGAPYVPPKQNRAAIPVTIDGVEIMIDSTNCHKSIEDLFTGIVFERQVESVKLYLERKYPNKAALTKAGALTELNGLPLPDPEQDFYTFEETAKIIAGEIAYGKWEDA